MWQEHGQCCSYILQSNTCCDNWTFCPLQQFGCHLQAAGMGFYHVVSINTYSWDDSSIFPKHVFLFIVFPSSKGTSGLPPPYVWNIGTTIELFVWTKKTKFLLYFEIIICLVYTPPIGSWWSQQRVMAASHCSSWWRWWFDTSEVLLRSSLWCHRCVSMWSACGGSQLVQTTNILTCVSGSLCRGNSLL